MMVLYKNVYCHLQLLAFLCLNGICTSCVDKGSDQEPNHVTEYAEYVRVSPFGVITSHRSDANGIVSGEEIVGRLPPKRIIGGRDAKEGGNPYQIYYVNEPGSLCGGSIYNSKIILTAAHCFYVLDAKKVKTELITDEALFTINFTAGEYDIKFSDGNEQVRNALKLDIHPNYNPNTLHNDIAIVTLQEPFEYSKFVQPIAIGPAVKCAVISGWGYTQPVGIRDRKDTAYFPNKLKEANVTIFSSDDCELYLKSKAGFKSDYSICAGQKMGEVDTCQGDSGGPLACYNKESPESRWLCGIVSGGWGCGLPELPGIYTWVDKYKDWIVEIAGKSDAEKQ